MTIWSLLTKLNLSSSYDEVIHSILFFEIIFVFLKLVGTAMKFLSTLAARSHHCGMFEGGDTLKIVCEQVILPNLFLRGLNLRFLFREKYFN